MCRSLGQQLQKHFHHFAGSGSSTGGLLRCAGYCWSPQERLIREVCAALDQAQGGTRYTYIMPSKQSEAYIVCDVTAWYVRTMVISLDLLSMRVTAYSHVCAQSVMSSLCHETPWHVHKSPVACTRKPCDTKAPWHVHKSLLYATHSVRITLHETRSWQQSPSMKTCMLDWNRMPVIQNSKACLVANTLMFISRTRTDVHCTCGGSP